MRLFTFSGIEGAFFGNNDGSEVVSFAKEVVISLCNKCTISYSGKLGTDLFCSNINFSKFVADLDGLLTLTGSDVLNKEASELSPAFAEDIANAMAADPKEPALLIAHSQGTNNCTYTLTHLYRFYPDFFEKREVKCVLFDPKVGVNQLTELITLDKKEKIQFLFFQSENDLLGNQNLLRPKFIDRFPHGNHIWVDGLDHSSIINWEFMNKKQRILLLNDYLKYRRELTKKIIELQRARTKPGMGPIEIQALNSWKKKYSMTSATPWEALIGFFEKELPMRFRS